MLLRLLLKSLVLPPTAQLLLIAVGLALSKRFPRLARACIVLALISLYLLSTSYVSHMLYAGLEDLPHLPAESLETIDAQAIVVLTGWQNEHTPEFGRPVSGLNGLSRARYAAFLHKKTQLPLLISGGDVFGNSQLSLAATMAYDLSSGFEVEATWLEDKSRTTSENARFSSEILKTAGVRKILLVSSAYHLKRAQLLFAREGMVVVPAPTFFVSKLPTDVRSFLPNAFALNDSAMALHEWLGYFYYRVMP